MGTDFSHQIRVLMCRQCGAPLEARIAGGTAVCGYCGVEHQLGPREQRTAPPRAQEEDEELRLSRLWAQAGRKLSPPGDVDRMLRNGMLMRNKVSAALELYNRTRRELASSSEHDASYRLTHLTIALYNHYLIVEPSPKRQRALLESAVEANLLPQHKQFVLGILSRSAVKDGDLQAAKDWLEGCDPHAIDLRADSSYRVGWALIATAEGDFSRVHQLLGPGQKDVPISDGFPPLAAVLRANAWEKTGSLDMGRATLKDYLAQGGPYGLPSLRTLVSIYPDLELCLRSMPKG